MEVKTGDGGRGIMDYIANLPNPMTTMSIKIPKKKSMSAIYQPAIIPTVLKPKDKTDEPNNIPPYHTFQLIPHSNIKNENADQFADVIAESYRELIDRWKGGKLEDQDRIFFETILTNKAYRTYITTNQPIADMVKQQAQTVWKNVTIQEDVGHLDDISSGQSIGYDLKLKFPCFLSLKTDRRLQELPLAELLEMSRFMDEDDQVFIQFGFQAAESEWYKDAEQEMEDFEKKRPKKWRKGDISQATLMKTGHFGFDFILRVLVTSPDERRRRRISRGILLRQLNYDNELIEKQVRPYQMKKWIDDIQQHRIRVPWFFSKRNIITGSEIAHFIKLPQRTLQEEYSIIQTVSGRETAIPERLKKGGIELGSSRFRGQEETIFMPTNNHDELCLPNVVIGGMGSGKTKGFGANFAVESVKNGFGSLVIDPAKGEMGDEIESSLPQEDVIRIRLGQVPIALDWNEVKYSHRAKNRLANTILSFFSTAADDTGAQTSRYIRAAVMAMKTGRLSEIMQILEEAEYRSQVIEKMPQGIHRTTLESFGQESDARKRQILGPIYNRLDTIIGDEYLAECMESDKSLDLVELMSQRKAVIIDVPKAELGPEAVDLIVNLLSTKIDLAMTLRKEEKQFPFFVIFDEPHQFLKSAKTWKAAAVESRKWRFGYVWMFHSWEQIPRDLAEIIKAAGPHYHIYSSSKKTFSDLKEEIAPFDVEEAIKLKRFHAINILRTGGEVTTPFIARMTPPPSQRKGA
jgi:hypothetical protein